MAKSTIPGHFLEIFEIFRGGKGSLDEKNRKIYLLNFLSTHQAKQLWFSEVFPKVLHFGR
jgi:hypothetical protein